MNLFDPNRPKTPNGLPKMVIGDDIIPHVLVTPCEVDKVRLSVMLNTYSGQRSYTYHSNVIPHSMLADFFGEYEIDPERTIKTFFDWEPQAYSHPREKAPEPPSAEVLALGPVEDLL